MIDFFFKFQNAFFPFIYFNDFEKLGVFLEGVLAAARWRQRFVCSPFSPSCLSHAYQLVLQ